MDTSLPEQIAPSNLGAVLEAVRGAADVRALLDAAAPGVASGVLHSIKREVDRQVDVDSAAVACLVTVADWAAERLGDAVSRALADASRARVLHATGRYREAEALFASSAEALVADGRELDAAALARQHMATLTQLGRYDEAFALARGARRVLARADEPRLLAEHETNTGAIYHQVDRHRSALACYARARAIFATLGDPLPLAYVDHNCAASLFELDRHEEALAHYESAAAEYRAAGSERWALQVDLAVAYTEYLRGHYHEALRRFRAAHEAGVGALNEAEVALTDLDMAEVYSHLNAHAEAEAAASRAAAVFESAGMGRELGTARRVLAETALKRGDAAGATALLRDVVDAFESTGHGVQAGLARLALAEAALREGEWATAAEAAKSGGRVLGRASLRARRRYATLLEARAALGAGDAVAAGRGARASLRAAERAGDDWLASRANQLLAEIEVAKGRRAAALRAYRAAIDAVERLRSRIVVDDLRAAFFDDKTSLYEGAVRLCLDAGTPEAVDEALTMLELSKSRTLADLLSSYLREYVPGGERGREAREAFRRLVDELAWRSRQRDISAGEPEDGTPGGARSAEARSVRAIAAIEAAVAESFRGVQLEDPRFAELERPRAVRPDELRALLGENEALVEYAVLDGAVSAVVVTRDGARAVRAVADVGEVTRLLEGLRFQLETFVYGAEVADRKLAQLRRTTDAYLGALYDALLRPLESHVGDRDLLVVPHGPLHYAPFHALFDGASYVVERRAVSYAPSATVYALCATAPRASGGPTLLCGVPGDDVPEIARELDALAELLPGARVLTGEGVTRDAFTRLAEGCGRIHLASHARFRSDNPMLSSLRLADGDLTFYDVFSLRLSADLVTLSGCSTGRAVVGAGDELHGLLRGFLYAGAPSLLLSMWAADDAATADLMRAFYAALGEGRTKREALRVAQLDALERYGHPYYWAPFFLLGRHS